MSIGKAFWKWTRHLAPLLALAVFAALGSPGQTRKQTAPCRDVVSGRGHKSKSPGADAFLRSLTPPQLPPDRRLRMAGVRPPVRGDRSGSKGGVRTSFQIKRVGHEVIQ